MTEKEYLKIQIDNAVRTSGKLGEVFSKTTGGDSNGVIESMVKMLSGYLLEDIAEDKKTATEIVDLENLIPDWKKEGKNGDGQQNVGDIWRYEGQVVKCCQAHNTNNNPDIKPDNLTFFVPYHTTDPYKAKFFVRPIHAESAYYIGECCLWGDGYVYRCTVDGTVYSPDEYKQAWERVEL